MAITLRRNPGEKIIELGGGAHPMVHPRCMGGLDLNVDCRITHNEKGQQTTDFTANFEELLPISSDEWDALFCQYCIEHISWRKIKQFISECYRIIKPSGKAVFVTANTKAQMQWVLDRLPTWDDHSSCILFGDLDYPENSHKNALSPEYAVKIFQEAGFEKVTVQPYGEYSTDMVIEAYKPSIVTVNHKDEVLLKANSQQIQAIKKDFENAHQGPQEQLEHTVTQLSTEHREKLFDKAYFNGGHKVGGYANEGLRDFSCHEITARHILARRPVSVLELGAARGYILKRIQDAGIQGIGLEISKHCIMTRVADGIVQWDLCKTPWPFGDKEFDLCFSVAVLEHIPENLIINVLKEATRVSQRQLHGVDFGENDDGKDLTHVNLKPKSWWIELIRSCSFV